MQKGGGCTRRRAIETFEETSEELEDPKLEKKKTLITFEVTSERLEDPRLEKKTLITFEVTSERLENNMKLLSGTKKKMKGSMDSE